MSWRKVALIIGVLVVFAGSSFAWDEGNAPPLVKNRDTVAAMFLSIGHPALGEWYNAGWGGWSNCNQKKFWLGFIPFYGWPGYLQVKSAIAAKRGKTW
jgi:hypothetical protein